MIFLSNSIHKFSMKFKFFGRMCQNFVIYGFIINYLNFQIGFQIVMMLIDLKMNYKNKDKIKYWISLLKSSLQISL